MFSKLMLVVVLGLIVVGCSNNRDGEVKGYIAGCSAMAHGLIDPSGQPIDDVKLAEFCKNQAQEYLKNNK
jgi:hypothetical protein